MPTFLANVVGDILLLSCLFSGVRFSGATMECFNCQDEQCEKKVWHIETCVRSDDACGTLRYKEDIPEKGIYAGDIFRKGCVVLLYVNRGCRPGEEYTICGCAGGMCNDREFDEQYERPARHPFHLRRRRPLVNLQSNEIPVSVRKMSFSKYLSLNTKVNVAADSKRDGETPINAKKSAFANKITAATENVSMIQIATVSPVETSTQRVTKPKTLPIRSKDARQNITESIATTEPPLRSEVGSSIVEDTIDKSTVEPTTYLHTLESSSEASSNKSVPLEEASSRNSKTRMIPARSKNGTTNLFSTTEIVTVPSVEMTKRTTEEQERRTLPRRGKNGTEDLHSTTITEENTRPTTKSKVRTLPDRSKYGKAFTSTEWEQAGFAFGSNETGVNDENIIADDLDHTDGPNTTLYQQ